MTGSPEQIIIEDADEVDVPEGSKDLHQTKSCVSGGAVMSSNLPKKKQPWVIELSSNSTSIKIKEELDSCTNSVELKHDQAITSCKHKLKTIFPSWKVKRITTDEASEELPCIKTLRGQQVAQITGKKRRTHHCSDNPQRSTCAQCQRLNYEESYRIQTLCPVSETEEKRLWARKFQLYKQSKQGKTV